jgi:hypothetical protein
LHQLNLLDRVDTAAHSVAVSLVLHEEERLYRHEEERLYRHEEERLYRH